MNDTQSVHQGYSISSLTGLSDDKEDDDEREDEDEEDSEETE